MNYLRPSTSPFPSAVAPFETADADVPSFKMEFCGRLSSRLLRRDRVAVVSLLPPSSNSVNCDECNGRMNGARLLLFTVRSCDAECIESIVRTFQTIRIEEFTLVNFIRLKKAYGEGHRELRLFSSND